MVFQHLLFPLLTSFFLLAAAVPLEPRNDGVKCGYESCPQPVAGLLNVHLVSHTHDDVGWLKTVDQYYYGSENRIQKANVKSIIDSVVTGLLHDPARRFVYVESAFFTRWWDEQTDEMKEKVKMLVNEGRLEFAGGAWSMNDEAVAHYQSIIDQFTLGLQFLNNTFGECGRPRVGWQIDPFGHSREQASLFTKMGFDGLFFSRLDYRDKWKRLDDKGMEMIWKSSSNLGDSDLFTGATYDHYYPPKGFCFDVLCDDEPFIDDNESFDYNMESRVKDFQDYVEKQATTYRTNNILLTMGGDFFFMSAGIWFKNLDKLIKYTNEHQDELKLNVFYSTPSCYLKALHDADITWPTKSDDFFPHANDPHAYWTGYYTSRPTSKRMERIGNQFLQICKKLTASTKTPEEFYDENLMRMKAIMGVMQHHDAITGTEKQHVADDYHREIDASIKACEANTRSSLNQAMFESGMDFEFNSCLNLNISSCSVSENSEKFVVTVYNALGHTTNQYVRFPVGSGSYQVRDSGDKIINSQIVSIPESVKNLHYRTSPSTNELVFQANEVPAVGYKAFFVEKIPSTQSEAPGKILAEDSVTIGNDHVSLTFGSNGLISSISIDGETSELSQNFILYKGNAGNNEIFANRSSGAYIFRPDPNEAEVTVNQVQLPLKVVNGDQVDEVHQVFNDWISQVVRIYKNEKVVEFEWMVGPIPVDDRVGKEIVSRFYTNLNTNGEVLTDSNGREMMKRKRNYRETWTGDMQNEEPVASNYYPINTKAAIEDENHRLALLTDRAQGGASITDGTVELMVHRRLLYDDAFGVAEALNEISYGKGLVARGKHWMIFGKKSTVDPTLEGRERLLQAEVLMSNWLFFDDASEKSFDNWKKNKNEHSAIKIELPSNVYLMTYEPWDRNSTLIRFEHILENNEDSELSKPVKLNLTSIFPGDYEFAEVNLAANQWIEDVERMQFKADGGAVASEMKQNSAENRQRGKVLSNSEITINPMEIRTFIMGPPEVSFGIRSQKLFKYSFLLVLVVIVRSLRF